MVPESTDSCNPFDTQSEYCDDGVCHRACENEYLDEICLGDSSDCVLACRLFALQCACVKGSCGLTVCCCGCGIGPRWTNAVFEH